jgi:thiol:disulfide interchange protein DsbC
VRRPQERYEIMTSRIKLLTMSLCVAACAAASAAEPAKDAKGADIDPVKVIASRLPGIDEGSIKPTPVPDLYEVGYGTNIAYVSADGRYLLRGDLVDLDTDVNLTEQRRNKARVEQLASLGEEKMIIFGPEPKDAKYEITVFTDVDCGYCRKLHSEIGQLNGMGVRVRYLFYPRTGPNTASWQKAEDVWCAPDRNVALTAAKSGRNVASGDCGPTPISEEWQLGQAFGVRGTPAIVTSDGALIAGYLPPAQLVARLADEKRLAAASAKAASALQ